MHISEGVLSAPVLVGGAALTVAGMAMGLKKLDYDRIPQVALLSAVFFLASLVHVPIGPAAVHLVLSGLVGLLLGWVAFPAIFIGLTLQAVLFQFGGLTSLGVNTFNMAFPAVVMGLLSGPWARGAGPVRSGVAGFLAGAGAVFGSGLLLGLSLVFTGQSFWAAAGAALAANVPVMIIEGLMTAVCVQFLHKVKPEVLGVAHAR